jgi:hypothetical protein
MEYKSQTKLLGLPLVHIRTGRMEHGVYRRGIARGWIAVGDIAQGILFGAGGLAFGLVAVGGGSVGFIALGGIGLGAVALAGMSIGALACGGMAVGYIAYGGLALALHAAAGGAALAFNYAVGGLAIAPHANDAAANEVVSVAALRAVMQSRVFQLSMVLFPLLMGAVSAALLRRCNGIANSNE